MHLRITEGLVSLDFEPALLIGLAFMTVMVFFVWAAVRGER